MAQSEPSALPAGYISNVRNMNEFIKGQEIFG